MLGYVPHPGQLLVHRSTARRRVLACGARWGKSLAAAMEACAALLEPRDQALGWIVAPTRDLVDRTFMRVVETLKARMAHRILELDLRVQRIVVTNLGGGTSELRGKSADQPVSLLGEALDFLIVDEAAKLPVEVWERHLSQRLVDRRGWVLFLSTPNGTNWFFDLFKAASGDADPNGEAWQSPSVENPHLDRSVIEGERERLSPEVFQQEYEAVFLGAEFMPCEVCGFDPNGLSQVDLGFGEPTCPACDALVGPDGRAL